MPPLPGDEAKWRKDLGVLPGVAARHGEGRPRLRADLAASRR